ncbi:MAG: hypothetical protein KGD59_00755 [Candidatus Heimdallarchaeota archaeon]|nr:hypothetical protein [Candidatus Heimdallarchaeota archaeon]MBY8993047.1 hypothetical protein [Candidatus Heimdallarchaeota archaeon]
MPTCYECGSTVEEGINSCPFCGVKLKFEKQIVLPSEIDEETVEIVIKQRAVPIIDEKQDGESEVLHTPNIEEMEFLEDDEAQFVTQTLDIVPERNYIYWALLGIISVGIVFLVYLFINIEDLEKHSQYPKDSRAESINVNASQTLLFFLIAICFGFIPVLWWVYYKKYSSLYSHIRNQRNDTAPFKIPHTLFYVLPLICSHLLAIVPLIIGWVIRDNVRFVMPTLFWGLCGGIVVLSIIPLVLDYFWQRAFNAHLKLTMAKLQIMKQAQPKTTEN